MQIDRRKFLKHIANGGAVLTAPSFLIGCNVLPATNLEMPAPANPFLAWYGIDEPMLARVMSALTAKGASYADIYLQHRRSHRLRHENGVALHPEILIEQGAGLRVIAAGRQGFAATEDLTSQGMMDAARLASAVAAGTPAASPAAFQPAPVPNRYPTSAGWSGVPLASRWAIIESLVQEARAADATVSDVIVDWHDSDERIVIATADGQLFSDERPITRLSVQVSLLRNGASHSGFASVSARQDIHWLDEARIKTLANTAIERARLRSDAKQPPPGDMAVVLAAGNGGILLHEALGHMLEADVHAAGSGPYADMVGKVVAPARVSVIDDATLAHERGALNVDDEGVPGQQNVLIEDGVLRSFLHDRQTASASGVNPTGSGRRETFRHAPLPRMTATYIANGSEPRDELLASVKQGIWAQTFSNGRVDPVTGDFSFVVDSGRYLEQGRPVYPIRDLTLHGNGPRLLQSVARLADDGRMDEAGWTCGKRGQRVPVSHGMPTALVTGLRVEV